MIRVISCRVIDPTSHGDGDDETAPVPPPAGEQYLISSVLPAVGNSVGSYNTTEDIPAGLILDTLA